MAENNEVSQELKVGETLPVSNEPNTAKVTENQNKSQEKPSKDADKKQMKKKVKDKKPNKIAKALKETNSELKKVTWPKFSTVVKQTGVVLLVTALFLLVVFGLDRLCSWLIGYIV